jgi:hypothetical protein
MEQVIERLRAVPPGEQDELARFLLNELQEEERWSTTSNAHTPQLRRLMDQVLGDDAKGRSEPLDPDKL